MKNIIYKLLAGVFVVFLYSCEEPEFPTFDEQYVAFEATGGSMNESYTTLSPDGGATTGNNTTVIEVLRSTTDFSEALVLNISVSAVYTSDSDFANAGDDASDKVAFNKDLSALSIPSGKVSTSFVVTAKEDLVASGDVLVSFEITSVSNASYKIGQQASQIRKAFNLTVIDDDCPIDLAGVWAGEYNVVSICAAPGAFNDGFCENTAKWAGLGNVTLAADSSDPLGLTAILSGGIHADDVKLAFQTCPMTVSIDAAYNLNIVQGSQARILPTDEPQTYGTGTFNPESLKFNIVVTYSNQGGSQFDEFIIEYEKVN